MAMRVEHYGDQAGQAGDLFLPANNRPPVVCLLHGGFWRMPYGRDQFQSVAEDLAGRGYAVWNLGYRRLGAPGGGWPGTFDDVVAGIEHLALLADAGTDLDLGRVTVVGHSAGGHLALWSAARQRADDIAGRSRRVRIGAVAGLAPVSDLFRAHVLGLGDGAVAELLGGTPEAQTALVTRYAAASPRQMLPLAVPQLILHGRDDEAVPLAMSREYCRAAKAAGDRVALRELPGTGHMEFLDPDSEAHAALCEWLAQPA